MRIDLGHTPGKFLQYAYRLDGGPWSAFSTNQRNMFADLSSGSHMVEVRT
ncbi:MAG: hypothetical protein R3B47_02955 [Bacteroidia bacterium]